MKTPPRTLSLQAKSTASADALERAFARRLTRQLGGAEPALDAHVERRLSAARWQAVEAAARMRQAQAASAAALATSGGARGGLTVWWVRFASCLPPLALTLGLIGIDQLNLMQRIEAAAEIDAALLADDLPPTAYTDPGFAEFVKQPVKTTAP